MKKVAVFSFLFLALFSVARGSSFKHHNEAATDAKKARKTDAPAGNIGNGSALNTIDNINFIADFGYVSNPVWKGSTKYNEVTFLKNNQMETAYYSREGELIGTTSEEKFSDLPASAQRKINSWYKDYKIGEVILFDDRRHSGADGVVYGLKFQYADNYFLQLTKGAERIILEVNPEGEVYLYTKL
jgi:hypothetical protein